MNYKEQFERSISDPEGFWREKADMVHWFEKPKTILSKDEKGNYRWFADGKINTAYLALDYHVENGRADQPAIYYDSPVTETKRTITYRELRDDTAKFAGVLRSLGVEKGDRVVIYMPMVPEALVAMLACARIGAIHSVVFGGFAAHELAVRIDDATPKVIVAASCGVEFTKVIPYKPLIDLAIDKATHKPSHTVILQRPMSPAEMKPGRDVDWSEAMAKATPADCLPVEATHPLYILYTSGTTGKPKGIVRDNGGHAVAMRYSMETVYTAKPGDVYWAASDVGWVVGHSYIVYAPLITGCTTIVFEGKPVRTPDAGTFWRIMEEYKVNIFFTAPTAFRAIKKEDPNGEFRKKYNLSNLRLLFQAGERLDPPTYHWLKGLVDMPIIDHWWQTETGWSICANPAGIELFPIKAGSATMPMPGYNVQILNAEGKQLDSDETGNIAIKLPLPPGTLPTLWNDQARFESSYLSTYPGYYLTGDGGYKDSEGYVFVMGRIDDVINVAGHRLSTGEMEELIGKHPAVAECAVVGIGDEMRGQIPVGFVVLKDGSDIEPAKLREELVKIVRDDIGAFAYFRHASIVKRLPKTRSGKILRHIIRKIADGEEFAMPSTIDDPAILDEVKEVMSEEKVGTAFGGSQG